MPSSDSQSDKGSGNSESSSSRRSKAAASARLQDTAEGSNRKEPGRHGKAASYARPQDTAQGITLGRVNTASDARAQENPQESQYFVQYKYLYQQKQFEQHEQQPLKREYLDQYQSLEWHLYQGSYSQRTADPDSKRSESAGQPGTPTKRTRSSAHQDKPEH
eukprot:539283-Amphidinium_carterae.1